MSGLTASNLRANTSSKVCGVIDAAKLFLLPPLPASGAGDSRSSLRPTRPAVQFAVLPDRSVPGRALTELATWARRAAIAVWIDRSYGCPDLSELGWRKAGAR